MREIEFRAFDKSTGKMIYDPSVNGIGHVNYIFRDGADQNYIWMQFTGLHDRNGRKIYEGDIIKWGHNVNTCGPEGDGFSFDGGFEEGFGNVTINPFGVWIGDDNPFFAMSDYLQNNMNEPQEEFEIIGNIHESPVLPNPAVSGTDE
jgi:uncharacterized phage protein (TIGR01671 family)